MRVMLVAGTLLFAAVDATAGSPEGDASTPLVKAHEGWGTATGYSNTFGFELQLEHAEYAILRRLAAGTYWHFPELATPSLSRTAVAEIRVPDGAALLEFRYWAYDASEAEELTLELVETCQPVGFGAPVATSLVSTQTAGASGNSYAAIPLGGTTVGNQDCTLSVRTGFGRPETDSPLERLMLRKVQVAWQRQVSPAPAVASFLDVPPGHLFFQFVEALVKSGITGGCGGGNFCPDATLTRGQMAAFLAKALGLQWP